MYGSPSGISSAEIKFNIAYLGWHGWYSDQLKSRLRWSQEAKFVLILNGTVTERNTATSSRWANGITAKWIYKEERTGPVTESSLRAQTVSWHIEYASLHLPWCFLPLYTSVCEQDNYKRCQQVCHYFWIAFIFKVLIGVSCQMNVVASYDIYSGKKYRITIAYSIARQNCASRIISKVVIGAYYVFLCQWSWGDVFWRWCLYSKTDVSCRLSA